MNLNIRCPLNMMLGYGHVSGHIIKQMLDKYECNIFPLSKNANFTIEFDEVKLKPAFNILNFDKNAPCLTIWHEFDLIQNHIGKGRMIGMPYWEINKLDNTRLANMLYCDDLIVSSKWAQDICNNFSVYTKTHIIPPGVDCNTFSPKKSPENKYTFINIGKIEKRKGHDILHIAFDKAFKDIDDVQLFMMCYSPFIKDSDYSSFKKMYQDILGEKVKFIEPVMTDNELSDIINSAHCGVFPSRSEGFGLPILQNLACGNGVITTNYSAHTEFCNESNSILMNIDRFEPAFDGKWFNGFGEWAYLDIDDLVHCMRSAYNSNLGRKINKDGRNTALKLSWENTGNKINELLTIS